jgi:hypothetical protein
MQQFTSHPTHVVCAFPLELPYHHHLLLLRRSGERTAALGILLIYFMRHKIHNHENHRRRAVFLPPLHYSGLSLFLDRMRMRRLYYTYAYCFVGLMSCFDGDSSWFGFPLSYFPVWHGTVCQQEYLSCTMD